MTDKMLVAQAAFSDSTVGMRYPVLLPTGSSVSGIRVLDHKEPKKGTAIPSIGIRYGRFTEPPTAKDQVFCVSVELP